MIVHSYQTRFALFADAWHIVGAARMERTASLAGGCKDGEWSQ